MINNISNVPASAFRVSVLALCAQYARRSDCLADRAAAGGLAGQG